MDREGDDRDDPGLADPAPSPPLRAFVRIAGTVLLLCLALAFPTLCVLPVARLCVRLSGGR
jgi:hypothetical protein